MAVTFFKYILFVFFLLIFQDTISAIEKEDSDTTGFDYYYNRASQFRNVNIDSTIFYTQKALSITAKQHDYSKTFKVYIFLIRSYKQKGEYALAIEKSQEAQQLIEKYHLTEEEPRLLMWIGNIYSSMGFSSKALEYLFKASKLATSKDVVKGTYYYTGLVYFDIGEIKKCQYYAHQCLLTQAEHHNYTTNVNAYVLLSNTYNNFDSISFYLNKAYHLAASNSELSYNKVVLLNNQALLYDMVGNSGIRNKKYQEAIAIAKQNKFFTYLPELYNNYAYALMEAKQYDSAIILLDTSLSIVRRNNNLDLQASLYDTYSDLYKYMKNYNKSLEYLRKSIHTREAYRKKQQVQTSMFLSAVFETQKKEKELLLKEAKLNRYRTYSLIGIVIILLLVGVILYFRQKISMDKIKLENLEKERSLNIADALIKGQDEERKRLAMDLHDGLGARLGALKLKVDTVLYDNTNYYDITSSIDEIARNVRELSHRMLPARLAEIGLIHSLRNLIRSVNASSNMKIEFETNIKQKLEDKIQVHLYYLIYELINNAIKHSHGNNLIIQLFIGNESLTLSAEDDGVGFNSSEKGEGHGLKNIRQRVDYLNGTIIIESEEGKGSEFMIEIPMV